MPPWYRPLSGAGYRWCRGMPGTIWRITHREVLAMRCSVRRFRRWTGPADVLEQLLRIGGKAFVSFPNFAHWRVRANLALRGRMPVNHALPESWHETPNIHHLTIADFRSLAGERKMRIEGSWYLTGGEQRADRLANLLAEQAVFLLSR